MKERQPIKGRPRKSEKVALNVRIRAEVSKRLRQAMKPTEVYCEHVEQVLVRGLAMEGK